MGLRAAPGRGALTALAIDHPSRSVLRRCHLDGLEAEHRSTAAPTAALSADIMGTEYL